MANTKYSKRPSPSFQWYVINFFCHASEPIREGEAQLPIIYIVTFSAIFHTFFVDIGHSLAQSLLQLFTGPGQTIGVAVFIDHFVADLHISQSTVAACYLAGTLAGATTLARWGRAIDQMGVRRATTIIAVAFSIALAAMAVLFYREYAREMREVVERVNFVNQVSHELKTPLTSIRMYADLLELDLKQLDAEDVAKPQERVKVIVGGGIVGEVKRTMLNVDHATTNANEGVRIIERWIMGGE